MSIFGKRNKQVQTPVPILGDRHARRKKMLVWALALITLTVGEVTEHTEVASGKTGLPALRAALADPLSLFAERSPGARGAGALHSTKGGPHERVLAEVRDREPVIADPPSDGIPTFPTDPGDPAGDPGAPGKSA